jgi:hypothetical protein
MCIHTHKSRGGGGGGDVGEKGVREELIKAKTVMINESVRRSRR